MTDRPADRVVYNRDIELAVFEQGEPSGSTLVLLHGWPDTHRLWDQMVPSLADTFRVITYDNRGTGQSTKPKTVAQYRVSEFVSDLFAVLDAVSPNTAVHIVGHDWGCFTGWSAACDARADGRIASFTSVSGVGINQGRAWVARRLSRPTPAHLAQLLTAAVRLWHLAFFQIPWIPAPGLRLLASRWPQFLRATQGIDPAFVPVADSLAEDIVNNLKLFRANFKPRRPNRETLKSNVPAQLIVSTRDLIPPAIYSDADEWASNLRRTQIPAGHWSPISHPELLTALVRDFITNLADPPPHPTAAG